MGPDSTPTFARTSHPSFYIHMEIFQQKYEVRVRGTINGMNVSFENGEMCF